MEYHKLSRLLIVGNINERVPMCVLVEIADAHGICFNKEDCVKTKFLYYLITTILETQIIEIQTKNIDILQMQHMARFVNGNVSWNKNKLLEAFNYLLTFTLEGDPIEKIPKDFVFGPQTPQNPLSINACVLYKICTYHKISTNCSMSLQQMVNAVKMLRTHTDSITRRLNSFIKHDANKTDLINMLLMSQVEVSDPNPTITSSNIDYNSLQSPRQKINYNLLSEVYTSLNNIVILRFKFDPITEAGAISLAAINFLLDISKSKYPIIEYTNLRKSGRDNYIPVDPWFQYWYNENPSIFDLTTSFNPLFCDKFYEKVMLSMVINQGFTPLEISSENLYELLQLSYISKTFYQGNMPGVKSGVTPLVNDNVEDIPYGELLCYGQIDSSEMEVISISELIDLFVENKNFSTPFIGCPVFSQTNINKLKVIAKSRYGCNSNREVSPETLVVRSKLLDVIISIELLTCKTDHSTKRFVSLYSGSYPFTKEAIVNCLTNLLELGMYMRGWSGEGNYPVAESNGLITSEEEKAVKVTEALIKYEISVDVLIKYGIYINKLPLVIYKDSEYQTSTYRKEGFTVGDRIHIIKQGDKTTNVESCIRLSSNWICSSAHKYLVAIGLPSPFPVWKLNYIS